MAVSTIYCKKCKSESHFFSALDGKSLKGTCGHIIYNRPEPKKEQSDFEKAKAKARKKLHVRKST